MAATRHCCGPPEEALQHGVVARQYRSNSEMYWQRPAQTAPLLQDALEELAIRAMEDNPIDSSSSKDQYDDVKEEVDCMDGCCGRENAIRAALKLMQNSLISSPATRKTSTPGPPPLLLQPQGSPRSETDEGEASTRAPPSGRSTPNSASGDVASGIWVPPPRPKPKARGEALSPFFEEDLEEGPPPTPFAATLQWHRGDALGSDVGMDPAA